MSPATTTHPPADLEWIDRIRHHLQRMLDRRRIISVVPIRSCKRGLFFVESLVRVYDAQGVNVRLLDFASVLGTSVGGNGQAHVGSGTASNHALGDAAQMTADWLTSIATEEGPRNKLLVNAASLREALQRGFSSADVVLCLTGGALDPTSMAHIDPLVIAGACEAVILLCEASNRLEEVGDVVHSLSEAGAHCLGVVLDEGGYRPPAEIVSAWLGKLQRWTPQLTLRWQEGARVLLADV
jgi:hypothetical protein